MKKTIVSLLAAATIVVTVAATDASAQWRGRGWGWGWGPGMAAGVVGGAIIAGAIIASRPPGYVVYEGYGQPVYAPGCYWASQPIYMLPAASSAIPASRCKSARVTRAARLVALRPDMLGGPPPAIRSHTACSASGHTIREPEPIWVTMASAIPVREPRC